MPYNNSNSYDNVYGSVIVAAHCHCESSPGSSDECSTQRQVAANLWGDAENAGLENAGLENAGPNRRGGNRRTGKRRTSFAGVENAGLENTGT